MDAFELLKEIKKKYPKANPDFHPGEEKYLQSILNAYDGNVSDEISSFIDQYDGDSDGARSDILEMLYGQDDEERPSDFDSYIDSILSSLKRLPVKTKNGYSSIGSLSNDDAYDYLTGKYGDWHGSRDQNETGELLNAWRNILNDDFEHVEPDASSAYMFIEDLAKQHPDDFEDALHEALAEDITLSAKDKRKNGLDDDLKDIFNIGNSKLVKKHKAGKKMNEDFDEDKADKEEQQRKSDAVLSDARQKNILSAISELY